ncbi:MAG TPA: GGDEF domain-containing phosphodiesterase [Steroidobacteraceae bacterium]|nr:GGDEF domain-containing phosphodiesterase [Steroidobacteraceae bacterium]
MPHWESDSISAKRYNAPVRADTPAGTDTRSRRGDSQAADVLVEALPDLALLIGRDGVVAALGGGRDTAGLKPSAEAVGKPLEASWPAPVAALLRQLTRKSIAQRTTVEARFESGGSEYTAQVSPRGPDRAVCIVRVVGGPAVDDTADTGARPAPQLDRRGFLQRFKESLSWAALRETPIALAVIHIDGITDIAQVLASQVSEQVMSAAIRRLPLPPQGPGAAGPSPQWYLGQLSEGLLAIVIESAEREEIEACVARVCASLREPVRAGDAEFHLTPYAGVARLGQDASTPKLLLEQARAAALEARRSGSAQGIRFFTDTLKLRALARIDLTRELRNAVANSDIRLRYTGRYHLESGRLAACVGYLRWPHPLRGEIRPAEFLRIAEATGLSASLSRAVLTRLRQDFARLRAACEPDVCISFGALRHHVLHEEFVNDVARLIADGGVPAERLELRVAEKVFITREPAQFEPLKRLGLRLIVDEVGRGVGSLDSLARAPIWGLQLDRAWVAALRNDPIARKVCRAGIEMAAALGLVPIATGVDDAATRDALLELGCTYGSGDLYRDDELDITGAWG